MKEDARTLPAAAQEEKRKQAVRMWKRNIPREAIAEQVGVHKLTVGQWLRRYQAGGMKALGSRRRGRRDGSGRHLSLEQELRVQKKLIDKTPDQLKLPYALWTRAAVQQLIQGETGLVLPIRTVGGIPQAMGVYSTEAKETGL